jgi:hypothetical protein
MCPHACVCTCPYLFTHVIYTQRTLSDIYREKDIGVSTLLSPSPSLHVFSPVCLYVSILAHKCLYVCICIYVQMYVCVCKARYLYTCTYIHMYVRICVCARRRDIFTYVYCVCVCVCVCACMCTYVHTYMHTYMRTLRRYERVRPGGLLACSSTVFTAVTHRVDLCQRLLGAAHVLVRGACSAQCQTVSH